MDGCGHQIFIFLFGCVCAAIWRRDDCTPCRHTRVRLYLEAAGAGGSMSWGWETADQSAPTCPASAVTLAMPPVPLVLSWCSVI